MSPSPTVLVVGAGPTGLTLALELRRQGIGVRIVDAAPPRPPTESRALGTNRRSMAVFDRLGVLGPMLDRGRVLQRFTLMNRRGVLGRLAVAAAGEGSPYPTMLMLPQSGTEEVLLAALAARGVEVERPVRLVHLEQGDGAVRAVVQHEGGGREEVVAEFVVGCDGARSAVRKSLGLDFPGTTLQGQYLMDAQVDWTGERPGPGEGFFSLTPASMAVATQVPGVSWRVIVSMQQGDPRMRRDTPDVVTVQAVLDRDHPGLGARLHSPTWASAFFISARSVPRMNQGRVLLAGDAAHIHSPVGGQGMNTGVADAANLAWKLALVHRGLAGEALLDTYSAERLPVVRDLLRTTTTSEHVLMARGPVAVAARDLAVRALTPLPVVRRAAERFLSGDAVAYPAGSAAGRRPRGPRAGTPVPELAGLRDADGRSTTTGALLAADPRHQLLVLTAGPASDAVPAPAAGVEQRWGALLAVHPVVPGPGNRAGGLGDPEGRVHRELGATRPQLLLVRPDGFIGFRGSAGRVDALERHLRSLTGREHARAGSDGPRSAAPAAALSPR